MSGLEVVGSIASVVQLAGAVYSISKQLYEVGSALSNAPSDIKDLAHDLEIFSEELLLHSVLTNTKNNHLYSSQIHILTIKIIGRCATICSRINGILKRLRSRSVLARLKWVFKEKEIRRLLERLRDLKLSLIGVLSMLRGLKADHMIDELGVATPSLLTCLKDMRVDERTTEQAEEIKKMLEDITIEQCKHGSLSGTTLVGQSSQSSAESRTSDSRDGCRLVAARTTGLTTASSISAPGPTITPTSALTAIPSLSAFAVTGINPIMQNASAMESVQSFHSAVSHLDHTSEGKSPHQMWQEYIARAIARHFNLSNGEVTPIAWPLIYSNMNLQPQVVSALQQPVDDDNDNDNDDDDTTRCICGFEDYPGLKLDEDAGFFLQCDICRVWQHGGCVGIKKPEYVPEEYSCEQCRKDLHRIYKTFNGRRCSRYIPPCKSFSPAPVLAARSNATLRRKATVNRREQVPKPLSDHDDHEMPERSKCPPTQEDAVLVSFMAGGRHSEISREPGDRPLVSNIEEDENPVGETGAKAEVVERKGEAYLGKDGIDLPAMANICGKAGRFQAWQYQRESELVSVMHIETGSIELRQREDIFMREKYEEGDDITIFIYDFRDDSERYFSLSSTTTLDKVFRAHSQLVDIAEIMTRFLFNGSSIMFADTCTCSTLDMAHGDRIDAHWEQIGGGGLSPEPMEEDRAEEDTSKEDSLQRIHSNQLWLRALEELRLESDGTSDLDCIWTEDIPPEILAQEAMKKLIDILSNIVGRLQDRMSQGALKPMQRIFEVVKVMESTMNFQTAALVWVCLQHVLGFLTNCSIEILRMQTPIFSQLAEITTLVARYTVLESIYQQWPRMSLDKNFEDSLISLGVLVLRFLEFSVAGKAEPMENVLREALTAIMGEINEADAKCRGFSVRIFKDGLEHALDEIDKEEEDSDDTTKNPKDGKRRIRGIEDEEGNRDGKEVENRGEATWGTLRSAKRLKIQNE